MVEIFEHPWIQKYKLRYEKWCNVAREDSTSSDESEVYREEEHNNLDNELLGGGQATLFNIVENDNETTGNYVRVNLKQKMEEMKARQLVKEETKNDSDSTRMNSSHLKGSLNRGLASINSNPLNNSSSNNDSALEASSNNIQLLGSASRETSTPARQLSGSVIQISS
jgi:hypothetical protein